MGVDGGGSALRVVLVDEEMNVLAQSERGTANPSSIGREAAAVLIQVAIHETLETAGKTADDVRAIALGIAGTAHAQEWVREVGQSALPNALIVPSSDFEIALVGARGERFGVIIVAGTGSVAWGINRAGESVQVGGWGYLLGDEGSGYWIGMEALKTFVRTMDMQRAEEQQVLLVQRIAEALNLSNPREIIQWTYSQSRVRDIAQLSKTVLELAGSGDVGARAIVDAAISHLAQLISMIHQRLNDHQLPAAFAGGLLDNENYLSVRLAQHLHLPAVPQPRYPPVMGAALLAKFVWKGT